MPDFQIYAGDTRVIPIDVIGADGVAVDLAEAQMTWVFSAWSGGTILLTKTNGNGIAVDETVTHRALVTIDKDEIAGLFPGLYYHALRVQFANVQDTVRSGAVRVLASPRSE